MKSNKNYKQIADIVNSVLKIISDVDEDISVELKQNRKSADRNFEITHREYIARGLEICGDIGEIEAYVVRNARLECGLYFGSLSDTSERTNISRRTVAKAFNVMQEKDLIRKYMDGVWAIHPKYLRRGTGGKYIGLLKFYNSLPKKGDKTKNEEEVELVKKIKKLY